MTVCDIPGRPDLYGLGIRIAFYIQWTGSVIVPFFNALIGDEDVTEIRFLGILLSAAVTVAIIITASSSTPFTYTYTSTSTSTSTNTSTPSNNQLQPADLYITLLLAAGLFLFLIPPYLLRLVTLCNPYWDPARWGADHQPGNRQGPISRWCAFVLLLAVASVGVWTFTGFLPQWWGRAGADGCDQFGFFFAKISLDDRAYVAFNAVLYIFIIIVCVGIVLVKSGCRVRMWAKERKRRKVRPSHRALLQTLQNISNLCVLVVLVTAVELTIQFNQIPSSTVNDLTTSSQLIPLFISAGIVVRVIFKWFLNRRINATASSPEYDGDPGVYYYEDGTYDPHGPQPPPPAHMA